MHDAALSGKVMQLLDRGERLTKRFLYAMALIALLVLEVKWGVLEGTFNTFVEIMTDFFNASFTPHRYDPSLGF